MNAFDVMLYMISTTYIIDKDNNMQYLLFTSDIQK
jgi:hypothetical protein